MHGVHQTKNWVLQTDNRQTLISLSCLSNENLGDEYVLRTTSMMHLHLLHLIRVELLLDALRQRGRQVITRRRLAPAIVHVRAERIIHAQIRRERDALASRGRRLAPRRAAAVACPRPDERQSRRARVHVRVRVHRCCRLFGFLP